MLNENTQIVNNLQEIVDRHRDFKDNYDYILTNYSYKIMSKGDGIYGMYFPERQLEKYFKYKGKITKNETNKDFVYYFDINGKLLLTERYSYGALLNAILFYYYDNKIEIVWYCMKKKRINVVGIINYRNNTLEKFIESLDITLGMKSFREYSFDTNSDYISIKSYMKYSDEKEIIMNSQLKK